MMVPGLLILDVFYGILRGARYPVLFLAALLGGCTKPPSLSEQQPATTVSHLILPSDALPAYEAEIDHAYFISTVNKRVIAEGREVYQRVCYNCHGDVNLPGSIPNSLRFAEGRFQHGSDPHTMYETITRGWRLMPPQVQLVPREKYSVIHYIREQFLANHNRAQLFDITDDYLADLPDGDARGPDPVKLEPWRDMDYGPFLTGTFEIATAADRANPWPDGAKPDYVSPDANIPYKGIAMRLDPGAGGVSQGKQWVTFEHDTLRVAGMWQGQGFIDWKSINFDGLHVHRPRTVGEPVFETADGPGWANPATGEFDDTRFVGLDGRRFGPLPRETMRFKGLYKKDQKIVLSYRVGQTDLLEHHRASPHGGLERHLNIGASDRDLKVRLSNVGTAVVIGGAEPVALGNADGFVVASIPAAHTPLKVVFTIGDTVKAEPLDLLPLTTGGPPQWPEVVESPVIRGAQPGPFQWDSFAMPFVNPWNSRLRATGIDFTPDGSAAIVVCWDGDVWRVDGIADESAATVSWRRIASGLFQPLGVKLIGDDIFVSCRDQIVRLHDLNGDGETDYYENFNSDHQVTEHFHEFAMGLQADDAGNLYYAKSARHARTALVQHHGTLLKVSADGASTEILANGFRAANGVCRNPDGTFFVTDQEGHWNPMNRINHVVPGNGFYGNMWSYGSPDDTSDDIVEKPLAWVDKGFDRSPSELLWIDSPKWGALDGRLLNLSYGHGRLELVPHESIDGQLQGGLVALPIPDFPTGTMRGRFHAGNGHLYLTGMAAWGTQQMQLAGGFFRVRVTGKPMHLPVEINAHAAGMDVTFSDPIDPASLSPQDGAIKVRTWALKRTAEYGSDHYNERDHEVMDLGLSADGKTLRIGIADMSPVWQMSISYRLTGANGEAVEGEIQNTIHSVREK
ncbi:MAG: c-type cytochrome [Synoicihabitans sp.]